MGGLSPVLKIIVTDILVLRALVIAFGQSVMQVARDFHC